MSKWISWEIEALEQENKALSPESLAAALWSTSAELGICSDPDCGAPEGSERVLVDPQTEKCITCGGPVRGPDRSLQGLGFDVEQCALELLDTIMADCVAFQLRVSEYISKENLLRAPDDDYLGTFGHDLWLTRNGHGAGYWDGDYAEPAASALAQSAKRLRGFSLYIGDDGLVYGQ